ncbi:hypothetical protein D3C77_566400 [compost metagenome]
MVLGCNIAAPCGKVFYRMIASAVAEFQLFRIRSTGQGQQLMSKADAKYRILAEQLRDRFNSMGDVLRIARTI